MTIITITIFNQKILITILAIITIKTLKTSNHKIKIIAIFNIIVIAITIITTLTIITIIVIKQQFYLDSSRFFLIVACYQKQIHYHETKFVQPPAKTKLWSCGKKDYKAKTLGHAGHNKINLFQTKQDQ
jgi:hypothetical protein